MNATSTVFPNHVKHSGKVRLSSIASVLLVASAVDFMALGGGDILNLSGIKFRVVLFLFAITVGLTLILRRSLGASLSERVYVSVLLVIAFYIAVSARSGTPFTQAFADANAFLALVYLPISYYVFHYKGDAWLYPTLFFIGITTSVVTIAVFIASVVGLYPLASSNALFASYGMGGSIGLIDGAIPRVYYSAQTFLHVAFAILLYYRMTKRVATVPFVLYAGIILLAEALSYTRGYWLALLITSIVFMVAVDKRFASRIALALLLFSFFAATIAQLAGVEGSHLLERVTSTASDENRSDIIRRIQAEFALDQFYEAPIFGHGFGAPVSAAYVEQRNELAYGQIEDPERVFVIELSYLDLLRKFGVAGLVLFAVLAFYAVLTPRFAQLRQHSNVGAIAIKASLLGFLVASATNPYLFSGSGMFFLALTTAHSLYLKNKVCRSPSDRYLCNRPSMSS